MHSRLVNYFLSLGIYEGESTHSNRAGCAVLLQSTGVSGPAATEHIGWKTNKMWHHYSREKMVASSDSASAIADAFESGDAVGSTHCLSYVHFDKLKKIE
jgi:hypothetical protein